MSTGWTPIGLAASALFSVVGYLWFQHGRRSVELLPMFCGVALMGYSYLFESTAWIVGLGIVFTMLPWVPDHVLPYLPWPRDPPGPDGAS